MSDDTKTGDKKPRRRLKAPAETVRQKQASEQSKAEKPVNVKRNRVGRILVWPFRKIAGWKVWQAKWFRPIKKVGHWIGLIIWPRYFRNSFQELKLVTWPGWKQSWRLTFAVLAFAAVFGLAIAGVDWLLDRLFKDILLK